MQPPVTPSSEYSPGNVLSQRDLYRQIRDQLPRISGVESSSTVRPEETVTSRHGEALIDDVRLLGALLGLIIHEHEGAEFYAFIERLRQASKYAREHSGRIGLERIHQVIESETDGLDDEQYLILLHKAVAAFRLFLLLAGIAEEYHHSRRFREEGQGVEKLLCQDIPMDRLEEILDRVTIRLVATAHPTKILRQTILHHQRDIFYLLKAMHQPDLTGLEQQRLLMTLAEKIEVLWATQFSRWSKPAVSDEVRRVLSYMIRTLYQTLPEVQEKLTVAMRLREDQPNFQLPHPLLKLGSWVGGDMDGNPFVTPQVFADALTRQHRAILKLHADQIRSLLNKFSYAYRRIGISEPLRESILKDLAAWEALPSGSLGQQQDPVNFRPLLEREPYRLKLNLMALKLEHSLSRTAESSGRLPFSYHTPEELLEDIDLLSESLEERGYTRSIAQHLDRLRQTIQTFGFHFASIDLREESAHLNLAAQALLKISGNPPDIEAEILSTKVVNTRHWPEVSGHLGLTPEENGYIERALGMLATARKAQQWMGAEACHKLVLTMAATAQDILNALLLLRTQGLLYPSYDDSGQIHWQSGMDLVPLFETIPDLVNAESVMRQLFKNKAYRAQLSARGNCQMVMVGYSDSNKDGGYFCSNWHIYRTQEQLIALAEEYGITLRFFHGRGGNLGRGGGPAARAVQALPKGSVKYGQDLTEQGEVLSRFYNVPETAQARCETLLGAIVLRNLETDGQLVDPAWEAVAERLSNISQAKYQDLVHNPGFLAYFDKVTPKEVELVQIGSRPTHRSKAPSIKDLRAIPWVFRWFQSRQILPGWYGLGTALEAFIQENPEKNPALLQAMYCQWPFFESVLENSEITLRQTDLSIARYYCSLAEDEGSALEILELIEAEYALTCRRVEEITGHPLLQVREMDMLRSAIELKEPYLDPLNYIQVQLLNKYRSLVEQSPSTGEEPPELLLRYHRAIVSSIEGIATGLGTSG